MKIYIKMNSFGSHPRQSSMRPEIRQYHTNDLIEILYLRNLNMKRNESAWLMSDLHEFIRKQFRITYVLCVDNRVRGYITYELRSCKKEYNILDYAIDPIDKQIGYDKLLIKHLTKRLKHKIIMFVDEYDLPRQLFLKQMNFIAVLDHEYYLNKTKYKMVYHASNNL